MPWINHSWHVTLIVTASGLTTGDLASGDKHFQINLDFHKHLLQIITSRQEEKTFSLLSLSVSACYNKVLDALEKLGINISINPVPNELENPIAFFEDDHNTYLPESATALHLVLLKSNEIFTKFRAGFIGKASPVHFFWGSFDLAVSFFSGRTAPQHPGGIPHLPDWIVREAYSHEVYSCGFWPGSEAEPNAAFYSYIYPEPEGFKSSAIKPAAAYYHHTLREYILPYDDVRKADDPEQAIMDFLTSTYNAAADLAKWNRKNLERSVQLPIRPTSKANL